MINLYRSFWRAQPRLLTLLEQKQFNVYARFQESVNKASKEAETIAEQLGAKECSIEAVRK